MKKLIGLLTICVALMFSAGALAQGGHEEHGNEGGHGHEVGQGHIPAHGPAPAKGEYREMPRTQDGFADKKGILMLPMSIPMTSG